jgi:hypothetical protein
MTCICAGFVGRPPREGPGECVSRQRSQHASLSASDRGRQVDTFPSLSYPYKNDVDPGFSKQDPDLAFAESVSVPKPGFLRRKFNKYG